MEKETILKVSDLSVNYGYVRAVRDVHIHVCKNEIVTLIGSNGAGKTTTLMAISNLVEKSSGKILFDNQDITKLPPDQVVRKGIAHVPERRKIFFVPKIKGKKKTSWGKLVRGRTADAGYRSRPYDEAGTHHVR